jgi:hypothetical protein
MKPSINVSNRIAYAIVKYLFLFIDIPIFGILSLLFFAPDCPVPYKILFLALLVVIVPAVGVTIVLNSVFLFQDLQKTGKKFTPSIGRHFVNLVDYGMALRVLDDVTFCVKVQTAAILSYLFFHDDIPSEYKIACLIGFAIIVLAITLVAFLPIGLHFTEPEKHTETKPHSLDDVFRLNENTARIFLRLISKIYIGYELITADGNDSLYVEELEEYKETPYGVVRVYSISQINNKTRIVEPEMLFFLIDWREEIGDPSAVFVLPHARMCVNNTPVEYSGIIGVNKEIIQNDFAPGHCAFANEWLTKLQKAGFVK